MQCFYLFISCCGSLAFCGESHWTLLYIKRTFTCPLCTPLFYNLLLSTPLLCNPFSLQSKLSCNFQHKFSKSSPDFPSVFQSLHFLSVLVSYYLQSFAVVSYLQSFVFHSSSINTVATTLIYVVATSIIVASLLHLCSFSCTTSLEGYSEILSCMNLSYRVHLRQDSTSCCILEVDQ